MTQFIEIILLPYMPTWNSYVDVEATDRDIE